MVQELEAWQGNNETYNKDEERNRRTVLRQNLNDESSTLFKEASIRGVRVCVFFYSSSDVTVYSVLNLNILLLKLA